MYIIICEIFDVSITYDSKWIIEVNIEKNGTKYKYRTLWNAG